MKNIDPADVLIWCFSVGLGIIFLGGSICVVIYMALELARYASQ